MHRDARRRRRRAPRRRSATASGGRARRSRPRRSRRRRRPPRRPSRARRGRGRRRGRRSRASQAAEPGEPEVAARGDDEEREPGGRERAAGVGEVGASPPPHDHDRSAAWPGTVTTSAVAPGLRAARAGRAGPARRPRRAPSRQRTRRSAETRTPNRVPAFASIRRARARRSGRRRDDLAGAEALPARSSAASRTRRRRAARPCRRPCRSSPGSSARAAPRVKTTRCAVDEQDRVRRLARSCTRRSDPVAAAVAVRRDRPRRRRDAIETSARSCRPASRSAGRSSGAGRPGGRAACRRPARRSGPGRRGRSRCSVTVPRRSRRPGTSVRTTRPAAVDDLEPDAVGLAQPELDRRDPRRQSHSARRPSAIRGAEDRARLDLQALGDRERGRRPAEQTRRRAGSRATGGTAPRL